MSNLILSDDSSLAVTRSRAAVRRGRSGGRRILDEEFRVAQIGEHETVVSRKYNVKQLKRNV